MLGEQIGHLLIELVEVIGDHAEFLERELHQPTVDRMQGQAGAEGVAQLLRRRAEARGREGGQRRGIGSGERASSYQSGSRLVRVSPCLRPRF